MNGREGRKALVSLEVYDYFFFFLNSILHLYFASVLSYFLISISIVFFFNSTFYIVNLQASYSIPVCLSFQRRKPQMCILLRRVIRQLEKKAYKGIS